MFKMIECDICMEQKERFWVCNRCRQKCCSDCVSGIIKHNSLCPYCRYEFEINGWWGWFRSICCWINYRTTL